MEAQRANRIVVGHGNAPDWRTCSPLGELHGYEIAVIIQISPLLLFVAQPKITVTV